MLTLRGVCKRFGARVIIDNAALHVAAGEIVAIVGESGSGKSTLLNLIAGLETPDAGHIEIGGRDLVALDDDGRTRLRREKLGFVFQAFHILPHLSVRANVELPLVLIGTQAQARRNRAQQLLDAVGLGARGESAPAELSGGELQRVAVARALAHRPAVVLADEPTGNLDPDTAAQIAQLLVSSVRSERAAGVLVTHSDSAARCADRVLRLSDGALHEVARGD
jgi:putative ABC transport system ATP-binding protein